jgi:hypothetical protein
MKNRFRDYRDRLAKRLADKRLTGNSFCPTGKGGGVDPSCSPGGGPPVKFDRSRHTEELGEATNEFFDDHPHATAKALDDRKVDSTPNRRLPDVSRPPVHELDVAKSLHNYTWGYDGPMNQALRKEGNPPSGEIGATVEGKPGVDGQKMFDNLQKAFDGVRTWKPPTKVWRGMEVSPEVSEAIERASRRAMDTGKAGVMPGFTSTSTSRREAAKFEEGGGVLFHIAASHGLDMAPYSHSSHEGELLLNHNSRFRVTKVDRDGNGTLHVHMEQIPPGATEPVPKAKRKKTTTNASDESSQPRNRMVGDEDEAHYWVQAFTS